MSFEVINNNLPKIIRRTKVHIDILGTNIRRKYMSNKLDWSIVPNKTAVKSVISDSVHRYDLFNLRTAEAVCYGKRRWGINLVWCDPAKSDNMRFQSKRSGKNPITFEEPIAIHVRKGKFLKYQKDRRGINLGWSDSPKFEWKIMGGKAGTEVKTGITISVFNTIEKDFLIYDPRDFGINLKWSKDKGKFNDISKSVELAKDVGPYAIALGKLVAG